MSEISRLVLQDRDISLLRDLLESRVLSLDHIRTLHFSGKDEMAKKRVQRLKAAGFVAERPRRIGEMSLLHLTWNGYAVLRAGGHIDDNGQLTPQAFTRRMKVSPSVLAHELAIMDVKVALKAATARSDRLKLVSFDVWPRRYEFIVQRGHERITVKPDAYVTFEETDGDNVFELNYFLELDMGTETQERLVEKCLSYREYYRNGGFACFRGGRPDEYKSYPFQVLIVCQSELRRENLMQRQLETQPPFSTMILATTLEECLHEPLGEIWLTPRGYLEKPSRLCRFSE